MNCRNLSMSLTDIRVKVVLVDIEGTTTSISFVHDVLFPYSSKNAEKYLLETWETESTMKIVEDLQQLPQFSEYTSKLNDLAPQKINAAFMAGFVRNLIEKDLKVTPLKLLQGLIWTKGYESGEIKGHVYEDVATAFQAWSDAGLRIAVYSSGSVAAQKLIFQHSIAGDLLPHLSAHFDTNVGHKQQTESYVNIAQSLEVDPAHVLFLTDVPAEALAARAAGMQAVILARPGNAAINDEHRSSFPVVTDFIPLQALKQP